VSGWKYILSFPLLFLSLQAVAGCFCSDAQNVSLSEILSHPDQFINKRVKVDAILRTDGKEYTRISKGEGSEFSILVTADDESTQYYLKHRLSEKENIDVIKDLFRKLRRLEGPGYERDLSKITYYRQDVVVCGRLVKSMGGLRFALDDMHVKDSYLLPWTHEQKIKHKKLEVEMFPWKIKLAPNSLPDHP